MVHSKNKSLLNRPVLSWALYDLANTSYSVIVVTVVFAIFFKQYICRDAIMTIAGNERHLGDFLWGMAGAVSMFVVAVSSPFMGVLADNAPRKRLFLFSYTAVTIVSMFLMFFLKSGFIFAAALLFIISNIGFEGGIVFYNSFLPSLAAPKYWGRLSGLGFGLGYVGSLLALLIALPIAVKSQELGDISFMRYAFPAAGLFFLVFSIPAFLFLKEPAITPSRGNAALGPQLKNAYQTVLYTIKNIKQYQSLGLFLLSYFLYIDGVNTVIYFGGIFAKDTLHFSMVEVITFFAIIQSSAIAGSIILGYVTDRINPRFTINISIMMWITLTIMAFYTTEKWMFYIVGFLAGFATGSIQAASRTLMSRLLPEKAEAEFFGFYALCGKFSSILGPLMFGLISSATGNQRYAIVSLVILFVAGIIILRWVPSGEIPLSQRQA